MNNIQDNLAQTTSMGSLVLPLKALIIASTFSKRHKTILWIVQDTEEMYQAEEDLTNFLDSSYIHTFYPADVRPYQDDSPAREIVAHRISVLYHLMKGDPGVIIAPFSAVLPYVIAREDLEDAATRLSVDMEIDRDDLALRLMHMGYTREALIDDVGQFSIRGSVIDIFSPGRQDPVRLDLFGDTISSIKSFNVNTQRSKKELSTAVILPASEILLDSYHIKNARPALRRMKDPSTKYLISDIEQGIYTPGLEMYLPLFYEKPASIFDYLKADSILVCPDRPSLVDLWDEEYGRYVHAFERSDENSRKYMPPVELVIGKKDIFTALDRAGHHISTSLGTSGEEVEYKHVPISFYAEQGSDAVFEYIRSLTDEGLDVFVFASTQMLFERLEYAFEKREIRPDTTTGSSILTRSGWGARLHLIERFISTGFILPSLGIALVSADEAFGTKKRRRRVSSGLPILNPFTQLNVGDAVVHRDNGIGIFKGVVRLDLEGFKNDFILLEYLGGDKLYVPVYKLSLLQRYIGDADHFIIDKLGGTRWTKAKNRAKESVAKLAGELLDIYAMRQSSRGTSFDTSSGLVQEFEDTFVYDETDDQLRAVEDMYTDMASHRPMDRLVCGDVGYGKTEVALRAAYVAVMAGKQVAVLVPTTLLARQHLNTFQQRFEKWPVRIEAVSSFSSSLSNREVLLGLEQGKVDIVIGTHALLSDKVKFKELGLLVVDEEHRFGVKHKELIKAKRAEVEILTLTATPIPRTLNMAISGIRDLSIIETPPAERKSIETMISRFDEEEIQQAIQRELMRGGQVFFVHNQVSNINAMAGHIQTLVPQARVGVAHGQMSRVQLERIMSKFLDRSVNVLVTSAIISSGIDIPSANTIVINRADKFGLADLYQLRGRVGRSKIRGFALLLIPAAGQITKDAKKRLSAIKEYESLGAGFQMALRDMEIRGVGDILGKAQWGHVTAIGYELYQQMLAEAVGRLQGKEEIVEIDPEIRIGLDAYIPEEYCPDQHLRLGLYKRLFSADAQELPAIGEEISDLYGEIPAPVRILMSIAEIRDIMKKIRLKKLERHDNTLRLYLARDSKVNLEKLIELVTNKNGRLYQEGIAEIPIGEDNVQNEMRDILYSIAESPSRSV
ncbi:MAG TPA: transcription-repair coupling factor [Deltaproteobacteria bacterium]|nr:transcription-repair coupling factor [Deltaproteobacteria bacterium]HPR50236.1 transcription-repair coupling factor [Deltaproteobacteria bacterium]